MDLRSSRRLKDAKRSQSRGSGNAKVASKARQATTAACRAKLGGTGSGRASKRVQAETRRKSGGAVAARVPAGDLAGGREGWLAGAAERVESSDVGCPLVIGRLCAEFACPSFPLPLDIPLQIRDDENALIFGSRRTGKSALALHLVSAKGLRLHRFYEHQYSVDQVGSVSTPIDCLWQSGMECRFIAWTVLNGNIHVHLTENETQAPIVPNWTAVIVDGCVPRRVAEHKPFESAIWKLLAGGQDSQQWTVWTIDPGQTKLKARTNALVDWLFVPLVACCRTEFIETLLKNFPTMAQWLGATSLPRYVRKFCQWETRRSETRLHFLALRLRALPGRPELLDHVFPCTLPPMHPSSHAEGNT